MKPLKNITGFSSWLMRIALILVMFVFFIPLFMDFKLNTLDFYIASAFIVFSVLLFAGGFFSTPLTVVSALILFGLSVFKTVIVFNGKLNGEFATWLLIATVCSYFITHGNK
ncbi:MAG: hypothetical protein KGZ97_05655 [Bacteroidetes bacterium]|nr:hypothetical protein [Bacteroidota bacterium]